MRTKEEVQRQLAKAFGNGSQKGETRLSKTIASLKGEYFSADWKDTEGLLDGFEKALDKLGIIMVENPVFEGSDELAFVLVKKGR